MKRIFLIDCPGCVPPSLEDTPEDILLRGVVRTENVEHPAQYIPAVLRRCQSRHLERTYDIKGWEKNPSSSDSAIPAREKTDKELVEDSVRFLELIARKGGRLLKGGEADVDGVAKMVLNDFLRGKIPWFSAPPKNEEGEEDKEEGRDEKLGLKRKRAVDEDGLVVDVEEDEEEEEGGDDSFEGFDGEEEGEGGVSLVAGESDSESEGDGAEDATVQEKAVVE